MIKATLALLAISTAVALTPAEPQQNALDQLAQAIGTKCQTAVGICPTAPAPVGSACACGQHPGFVRQ